jgi:hypothetical protein
MASALGCACPPASEGNSGDPKVIGNITDPWVPPSQNVQDGRTGMRSGAIEVSSFALWPRLSMYCLGLRLIVISLFTTFRRRRKMSLAPESSPCCSDLKS